MVCWEFCDGNQPWNLPDEWSIETAPLRQVLQSWDRPRTADSLSEALQQARDEARCHGVTVWVWEAIRGRGLAGVSPDGGVYLFRTHEVSP